MKPEEAREQSRLLVSAQRKLWKGEPLTPDEQAVWDRATDETHAVGRYSIDGKRLDDSVRPAREAARIERKETP